MAKKSAPHKNHGNEEGGIVYSTNANFAFSGLADLLGKAEDESAAGKPLLEVHLEKKHRGGKAAIIIKGFEGSDEALTDLAKKLKTGMGVGGSAKDGEIIIQGDRREKVMELLQSWGYKTKRVGG
jgi:translation initiation factor 1